MAEPDRPEQATPSPVDRSLLEQVSAAGILRPRDLKGTGIERVRLRRLVERGLLVQLGRGLYSLPSTDLGVNESLAAACMAVPHGVICLLSALRFHELTTQAPSVVWLAIPSKARASTVSGIPIHFIRSSPAVLEAGVEEHVLEGVTLRVYSPAKTVADCFKHRSTVGLDVALEALREFRRTRRGTLDELWELAGACRVQSVLRPYLEATS